MQCASSTTSRPQVAARRGSTSSRKPGLLSRSGLTSSTSTSPALTAVWISSHCSTLVELIVTARMPARSAAAIWLRISASSGETITVGPAPCGAQQERGHEVDRRLAPTRALDHQRPPAVDHERLDRGPLVVAQHGVLAADQRAQMSLGVGPHVGRGGHVSCLAATADPAGGSSTGRRGLRPGTPRAARSRTAHTAGVRRAGPRVAADSRSATGPTTRRPRTAPTYRR